MKGSKVFSGIAAIAIAFALATSGCDTGSTGGRAGGGMAAFSFTNERERTISRIQLNASKTIDGELVIVTLFDEELDIKTGETKTAEIPANWDEYRDEKVMLTSLYEDENGSGWSSMKNKWNDRNGDGVYRFTQTASYGAWTCD